MSTNRELSEIAVFGLEEPMCYSRDSVMTKAMNIEQADGANVAVCVERLRNAGIGCIVSMLLPVILAGCGNEVPAYYADLVNVSGKVTFDSEPVEGAVVTFVAKSGPSRSSTATTDSQGEYFMTTPPAGDGVLPGSYDVVISKLILPDGSPVPADVPPMDVGAEEQLPGQYSSFANPSLSADVGGDGGSFIFDLKTM